MPTWMTIPEASQACRELIRCSCKGNCHNCKCGRAIKFRLHAAHFVVVIAIKRDFTLSFSSQYAIHMKSDSKRVVKETVKQTKRF